MRGIKGPIVGVWIEHTSLIDWDGGPLHIGRPAWRLSWFDREGLDWSHQTPFPTPGDALRAMNSLHAIGVTLKDFLEMPLEGEWKYDQVMLDSLGW